VAGSANLDFVVRVPHIPAPGETVLGHGLQTFPGGKGANQAVACSRAGGAPTQMLLALGNDAQAAPIEASLRAAGVALHIVRSTSEPTGTAFIGLSDSAENAITVAPGANNALAPEHLPPLAGVSHLLLQLETPLPSVLAYARQARAAGVCVVFNAALARALSAELLAAVDLLIVNEGELAMIAGTLGTLDEGLAAVSVPSVVVTLGARGCLARSGGQGFTQAAMPIDAVDTTAAGDTFCGALVAALSQGEALPAALRRASAAAALACTRLGAQTSIPSRAEVDAFLLRQP
jgi:ribokinase